MGKKNNEVEGNDAMVGLVLLIILLAITAVVLYSVSKGIQVVLLAFGFSVPVWIAFVMLILINYFVMLFKK